MAVAELVVETKSHRRAIAARHPLPIFFLLAYAGTWAVELVFVLSHDGAGVFDYASPIDFMTAAAIGTFSGPTLAAFILSWCAGGAAEVRQLVQRIVRWRVGLWWFVFALAGIPAIMTLGTLALPDVWASRQPLDIATELPKYGVFFFYPALLIGGPLGEEIGWRGFALPRVQEKFGPLGGSLVLGVLWGFWHAPVWFSGLWTQPTALNILLFNSWITAMTFIITWASNRTRASVLIAILIHASMDAFPNAILWPTFPKATEVIGGLYLYGYVGLLIGYGLTALVLLAATRGRLGAYSPARTRSCSAST